MAAQLSIITNTLNLKSVFISTLANITELTDSISQGFATFQLQTLNSIVAIDGALSQQVPNLVVKILRNIVLKEEETLDAPTSGSALAVINNAITGKWCSLVYITE